MNEMDIEINEKNYIKVTYDIYIRPIKIFAVGRDKRYMWFTINDEKFKPKFNCTYKAKIKNEFYQFLKSRGVPTSQSLRKIDTK